MKQYEKRLKENINKHNLNWSQSLDHLYRILVIGACASGKKERKKT